MYSEHKMYLKFSWIYLPFKISHEPSSSWCWHDSFSLYLILYECRNEERKLWTNTQYCQLQKFILLNVLWRYIYKKSQSSFCAFLSTIITIYLEMTQGCYCHSQVISLICKDYFFHLSVLEDVLSVLPTVYTIDLLPIDRPFLRFRKVRIGSVLR